MRNRARNIRPQFLIEMSPKGVFCAIVIPDEHGANVVLIDDPEPGLTVKPGMLPGLDAVLPPTTPGFVGDEVGRLLGRVPLVLPKLGFHPVSRFYVSDLYQPGRSGPPTIKSVRLGADGHTVESRALPAMMAGDLMIDAVEVVTAETQARLDPKDVERLQAMRSSACA